METFAEVYSDQGLPPPVDCVYNNCPRLVHVLGNQRLVGPSAPVRADSKYCCDYGSYREAKFKDWADYRELNIAADGCGPDGDPTKIVMAKYTDGLALLSGDTFIVGHGSNGPTLKFNAKGDKAFCVEEMFPHPGREARISGMKSILSISPHTTRTALPHSFPLNTSTSSTPHGIPRTRGA